VARVRPPIWTGEVPEPIAVPVEIVADEEFRARYGPGWAARADLRVERASALLRAAGLRLDVRWHGAWRSSAEAADLSALLDDLAGAPRRDPRAIRVAFTGQVGPDLDDPLQDVGRAYLPGRDLVVADQPPVPGQSTRWDEAEEATILAHEVLHALGAPHLDAGHYVMSSPKSGTSHALAASTRALARSAAEARFATRDDVAAATLLGEAAAAWIEDRDTQVAYVGGNLSLGPGVPDPERIPHLRTSALVSLALAAGLDP
jgi:hypothetical protein